MAITFRETLRKTFPRVISPGEKECLLLSKAQRHYRNSPVSLLKNILFINLASKYTRSLIARDETKLNYLRRWKRERSRFESEHPSRRKDSRLNGDSKKIYFLDIRQWRDRENHLRLRHSARIFLTLTPCSRQGRRFAWCSNGPTKTTVDLERSRCRRSARRAAAVPWPVKRTASCSPAPTACRTMSLASCLQRSFPRQDASIRPSVPINDRKVANAFLNHVYRSLGFLCRSFVSTES